MRLALFALFFWGMAHLGYSLDLASASVHYSFDQPNSSLFLTVPDASYAAGEVEYGDVPNGELSNGKGLIVRLSPGQGFRLFAPPTSAMEGLAHIQCSLYTSSHQAALAIAALNVKPDGTFADLDGSLCTQQLSNSQDFAQQWKIIDAIADPSLNGVVPLVQAVPVGEQPVTVYIDNLIITPLGSLSPQELYDFLNPKRDAIITPTSTPTLPPMPTGTPSFSPTPTTVFTSTPTPFPASTPTPEGPIELPEHVTIELANLPVEAAALGMVLIPAGEFMMGSTESESGHQTNEGPQHRVVLTQPFYMGKYEITQAQWQAVMGTDLSVYKEDINLPVDTVSWFEAQQFTQNLSTLTGKTFRLPTEAEWEYACRAGESTRFYWGEDPGVTEAYQNAWFWNNSDGKPHPVGKKGTNDWGIFDLSGNQHEWCLDWYNTYSEEEQINPVGSMTGEKRVIRGGFWGGAIEGCRSAARDGILPHFGYQTISFRVVMNAPAAAVPTPAATATPAAQEAAVVVRFGSTLQSHVGESSPWEGLDRLQEDHLGIVRYFAHESVTDNISMINAAAQRNLKVIMDFACGNEDYGINGEIPPCSQLETDACCSVCWWNLDLLFFNNTTGVFLRRYTADPAGFASWVEFRLSQIEQALPGAIGSTVIAIQIGNEEEGKWQDPQTKIRYEDGECYYGGRLFGGYFYEVQERIRERWPTLEMISGCLENDRSLDYDLGGISNYGRWARAFLYGFIEEILQRGQGDINQLPDTVAFNGYPGKAPPEYLHEGVGTREWINRLDTLETICNAYGYSPQYMVSEFGFSPNSASNYGCQDADERTQAVYFLRKALMDATMQAQNGKRLKYSLYWEHPFNGINPLTDTGWFNGSGENRAVRKAGQRLYSSGNPPLSGLGLRKHTVWIPAYSVRNEENPAIGYNRMVCGWENDVQEKWAALWSYKNNTGAYFMAPAASYPLVIRGENPGPAHLYKFRFSSPYGFDQTEWIQVTEAPIKGRPVNDSPQDTEYNIPATLVHSQYGSVNLCTENPVFVNFGK